MGGVGHAAQPNSLLFLRRSVAEEMDSIHSSSTASVPRLTHRRCLGTTGGFEVGISHPGEAFQRALALESGLTGPPFHKVSLSRIRVV